MDAQQADSWVQMVKKHKTNAQGHLRRENAQLEHAETPYVSTLQDIFWKNLHLAACLPTKCKHDQ